ncbi:hypothetical protein CRG98_001543 [Punica granatum]|uniref:Uncharacterized protein n=1 Tax=Punica granatum TaxID=22663 RepID=A0A2I0LBM7_PUNGR|nr:hypothetical protein CRG98_001543 [Punica granatum]
MRRWISSRERAANWSRKECNQLHVAGQLLRAPFAARFWLTLGGGSIVFYLVQPSLCSFCLVRRLSIRHPSSPMTRHLCSSPATPQKPPPQLLLLLLLLDVKKGSRGQTEEGTNSPALLLPATRQDHASVNSSFIISRAHKSQALVLSFSRLLHLSHAHQHHSLYQLDCHCFLFKAALLLDQPLDSISHCSHCHWSSSLCLLRLLAVRFAATLDPELLLPLPRFPLDCCLASCLSEFPCLTRSIATIPPHDNSDPVSSTLADF